MAKEKDKKSIERFRRRSRRLPPGATQRERTAAAALANPFEKEVAPALLKELELKNAMAVPRLNKIVVNMGMGEATQNAKMLDPAVNELGQITGQKPITTKAKKSIAAFKVREGQAIGAMVTLRGDRMYEFFDRLVNIVLPRVRDFKGVSTKSFDGRGNYTPGSARSVDLPGDFLRKSRQDEGHERHHRDHGGSDDQARSLLKHLGMPFRAQPGEGCGKFQSSDTGF
jgi:large subunit ribosomal protein L5